jgi:threonine dehydratase
LATEPSGPRGADPLSLVTEASIARAARAGAGVVRETPIITTRTLSERAGTKIVLKAENLQGTGSFKLRGATAKLAALGDEAASGVVCGSAGNHAQAVAYAARSRGVPCEVFMPEAASITKAEAVQALGATLHLGGHSVDECVAAANERAAEAGMQFVHPFDDVDVISGQGSVGLELLHQVPDLARVVVPVGGGGLISGIAVAIRSQRPDVEIIGIQVEACAPFVASLAAGAPVAVDSVRTIADGIAIKRPAEITLKLIAAFVKDMLVVSEDQVAEAMVFLMERAKLVVEGAGAVGVAALLAGRLPGPVDGATVLVLSGGNVGAGMLAEVARRHETQAHRRLVLRVRISDLPGSLAALLATVSAAGANLVDVQHIREGVDLHIQETAVQLVLETRGAEHAAAVRAAIAAGGYQEATEMR